MGRLQTEDIMPNDGTYFAQPKEQVIERKKEKAHTLEGLEILKTILGRLEERIAFYEKVTTIPDAVRAEPDKFLILHNTYTLVAKTLTEEKEYIVELLDEHAKGR